MICLGGFMRYVSMLALFTIFFLTTSSTYASAYTELPLDQMADRTFFCESSDYRAKFTESANIEESTALTLQQRGVGLIAKLENDKLVFQEKEGLLIYQGVTKNIQDGRFIGVKIEVLKAAENDGPYKGKHVARLTIHRDGEKIRTSLFCKLK